MDPVVGHYRLRLAGVPRCPDSLLILISHQIVQSFGFLEPPDRLLSRLRRDAVNSLILEAENTADQQRRARLTNMAAEVFNGVNTNHMEIIQLLHANTGLNFHLFMPEGERFYQESDGPVITLFYRPPYFDGIVQVTSLNQIVMGTWNLRGALDPEKQLMIDEYASQREIAVLCLQETHLSMATLETTNYIWHLGPQSNGRASRGCGFLVHKKFPFPVKLGVSSLNICYLDITFRRRVKCFRLFCVHRVSEGNRLSSVETGELIGVIRDVPDDQQYLICGDFNAHVSRAEHLPAVDDSVGPYLLHDATNSNGRDLLYLLELFDLKLMTSIHHHSTIVTRYGAGVRSQIDHILMPPSNVFTLESVRGFWTKLSDHKLITCNLQFRDGKTLIKVI